MEVFNVVQSEATAAKRRVYFKLISNVSAIPYPAEGETGGQPQVSIDGAAFSDSGIGVLVAVSTAAGRYYAELTQGILGTAGQRLITRYKSDNTLEAEGSTVVVIAEPVDAVFDEVVEGAVTFRQMVRGFAAALMAKCNGLASTTASFRDLADTKDRIVATVDADGNRTEITLDLT